MIWSGFFISLIVMAFTPGPNNLVSFEYSRRLGFRRCVQLLLGLAASIALAYCAVALWV